MSSIIGILALLMIGYSVGSVRVINQGNEALIERLGKYHRKLRPGLNFIVPFLDSVVLTDSVKEQILDIEPQKAITKDNVPLDVDAVVYWRILELELTYYAIEDIEKGIRELVITTLRSEIGKMDFETTFSSRDMINRALLSQLDEATEPWGVKVTRVEVQEIDPPEEVKRSMLQQQAADLKARAVVREAEGEEAAALKRANTTVKSIKLLSDALGQRSDAPEVLKFLLAQQYVEANQKLGESQNSKVLFMDPKFLSEGLIDLMNSDTTTPEPPSDADDFPSRRRRPSA